MSSNPFGTAEHCALCQERIEYMSTVGRAPHYMHVGEGPYDHGAVRQRNDPQPYEPYDPAEQSNGPVPTEDDVPNYAAETVENPKVPLISTTEDYHGKVAEMLKVDVEVRSRTRLFLVYLAAVGIFLLVATATYGLLQATPWPLSWWSCLALTVLFRIGIVFGRWRFSA